MTVKDGLPLENLRIQLEGRLPPLERSVEAMERITRALRSWRWRVALAREGEALRTLGATAPEAESVLTRLSERMEREGWPAHSEAAQFVRRAKASQERLFASARARMGGASNPPEVLGQLAEWERELSPSAAPGADPILELQPGSWFGVAFGLFSIALGLGLLVAPGHEHPSSEVIGALALLLFGAPGFLFLRASRPLRGVVFRGAGKFELRRGWLFPRLQRSLTVLPRSELRVRRQEGISDGGGVEVAHRLEVRLKGGETAVLATRGTEAEALEVAERLAAAFGANLHTEQVGGTRLLVLSSTDATPAAEAISR